MRLKGLEFPIVAVADFAEPGAARRASSWWRRAARPHMPRSRRAVRWTPSRAWRSARAPAASRTRRTPTSPPRAACAGGRPRVRRPGRAGMHPGRLPRQALRGRAAAEELAEARRKLYVGLARASRGAGRGHGTRRRPRPAKPPAYPALVDDVRSALCGAADFAGGRGPAGVRRQRARALRAHRRAGGGRRARRCRSPMRRRKGRPAAPVRRARRSSVPRMAGFEPLPRRPWRPADGWRSSILPFP